MEEELRIMALKVIEVIAAENEYAGGHNMGQIYKFAHTATSPDCRKNHQSREQELRDLYKTIMERS